MSKETTSGITESSRLSETYIKQLLVHSAALYAAGLASKTDHDSLQRLLKSPSAKPAKEQLLTEKELCELLKVTRITLHNWRKAGKLHSRQIGKCHRYKLSDIQKLIDGEGV